ncbi:hypothetical protein [Ovoidimarina sediminis]|uniref:hypothetical protein n=1 Tax=Ovoidimarina sediminis TaxID=3079856 RepID=UPI00290EA539|nr:hypothetical protein [Rhodophyticola sp. MJ-SS7]MDU8945571.1 hypothetical protein [Rhodophyticola sp. MJ-SS7]
MANGGPENGTAKRRPIRRLPPNKRQGRWDLRLEEARARREAALAGQGEPADDASSATPPASPVDLPDERDLRRTPAAPRHRDPFTAPAEAPGVPPALVPEDEGDAPAGAPVKPASEPRSRQKKTAGLSRRLLWGGLSYGLLAAAVVYTLFETGILPPKPSAPERLATSPLQAAPSDPLAGPAGAPALTGDPPRSAPAPATPGAVALPSGAYRLLSTPPAPLNRPPPRLAEAVPRPSPLPSLAAPAPPPLETVATMRFDERYRGRPAMMPFNLNNLISTTAPPPRLLVIPVPDPVPEIAVTPTLLIPLRLTPPAPRPGIVVPVFEASDEDARPRARPVPDAGDSLSPEEALSASDTQDDAFDGAPLAEAGSEPLADNVPQPALPEDNATPEPLPTADASPPDVTPSAPPRDGRVVLFAPSITSDTELGVLGAQIRAMGFGDVTERRHGFGIADTQIRYYFAADRPAALDLAQTFDGDVRDFTGFTPRPEPGLIEVWLPGEAPVSRSATAPAAPEPPERLSPVEAVGRTLNRIIDDILP